MVPNSRVSCCRPPSRASLGTRIVTATICLPISIPAARSQNSGSPSTSCIVISYHEDAVNGRGRPRELGASGNLVRGLVAPIHSPQGSSRRQTFRTGSVPPKSNDVSGRPHHRILHPHAPPRGRKPAHARQPRPQSASNPSQPQTRSPQNFHAITASPRAPVTLGRTARVVVRVRSHGG